MEKHTFYVLWHWIICIVIYDFPKIILNCWFQEKMADSQTQDQIADCVDTRL